VRKEAWFSNLLNRPEFAAISGAVLVFIVFAFAAGSSGMFNLDGIMNWSQVAAYLGMIAVGACLLMIAGEFDLSIGSMIGFAGMMVAIPSVYFGTGRSRCRSCSPSPVRWRSARSTAIS
jgi:simple sugar transport system permease protein